MVKALFDTNILIDFLRGRTEARVELERYRDPAISIITWIEVMVEPDVKLRPATQRFLERFEVIGLDHEVASRTAEIRRELRLRMPDAIIRATAEVGRMLLVTRNTKDFDARDPMVRVPYTLQA